LLYRFQKQFQVKFRHSLKSKRTLLQAKRHLEEVRLLSQRRKESIGGISLYRNYEKKNLLGILTKQRLILLQKLREP